MEKQLYQSVHYHSQAIVCMYIFGVAFRVLLYLELLTSFTSVRMLSLHVFNQVKLDKHTVYFLQPGLRPATVLMFAYICSVVFPLPPIRTQTATTGPLHKPSIRTSQQQWKKKQERRRKGKGHLRHLPLQSYPPHRARTGCFYFSRPSVGTTLVSMAHSWPLEMTLLYMGIPPEDWRSQICV